MKDSKALFDNDSADSSSIEEQSAAAGKPAVGPTLTLLETGQNPGAILKTARERLGYSISEISLRTKINEKQLAAIESGDTSKFPPSTFAKAFIKSYCKVVDLDAAPILLAFGFESSSAVTSKVAVSMDQGSPAPRMPSNSRRLSSLSFDRKGGSKKFGFIAAALVAGVFVAFYLPEFLNGNETTSSLDSRDAAAPLVIDSTGPSGEGPSEPASIPVPDGMVSESIALPSVGATGATENGSSGGQNFVFPAIQEEQAKSAAPKPASDISASTADALNSTLAQSSETSAAEKPGSVGSSAAAAVSTGPSSKLRFVFSEESWVTVRDADNKVLMSQLNQSGSEAALEGTAPFKLVVGNADSVLLFVNGKAYDLTSKTRGEVARLVVE